MIISKLSDENVIVVCFVFFPKNLTSCSNKSKNEANPGFVIH